MQIHVLSITHKHGVNVTVHKTADGAAAKLAEYVREEWAAEIDDVPALHNDDLAITFYFERLQDREWYDITELELQP